MTGAARAAVWAYALTDGDRRRFEIHLRTFARHAPGLVRTGLTAAQVRAALTDEPTDLYPPSLRSSVPDGGRR